MEYMGRDISKQYSSSVFIQSQSNFMRTLATRVGYRPLLFLEIRHCFQNFVALWSFNMGVHGEILICAISWKQLMIEWNWWQFVTHSPRNYICSLLFLSESLSSVWNHLVHLAKFWMFRFSKGYSCHSFHSISTKLYGKVGNQGWIENVIFGWSAKF